MKIMLPCALCVSFLTNHGAAQDPAAQLARDLAQEVASSQELVDLARRAVELFGSDSETGRSVQRAWDSLAAEGQESRAVVELRRALDLARSNLEFEPLLEAPLPDGWPETTPVDRIELRAYPAYRAAWVDSSGERALPENRMFMTLFRHIQRENIAMTAPVEMGYGQALGSRPSSMAFLYRHTEQGRPGVDGAVDVADMPATLVVSLGMRGMLSEARLAAARARLERWLESQGGRYEQAGEIRVLGYNSPFVPWLRRYSEVQLPVRPAPEASGPEGRVIRSV